MSHNFGYVQIFEKLQTFCGGEYIIQVIEFTVVIFSRFTALIVC